MRIEHGLSAATCHRFALGSSDEVRTVTLPAQVFMDPEILDLERAAPGEARQPGDDRAIAVADKDGKRAIVIVASDGDIVGVDAFLDEADVGLVWGILDGYVLCLVPALILLGHDSSPIHSTGRVESPPSLMRVLCAELPSMWHQKPLIKTGRSEKLTYLLQPAPAHHVLVISDIGQQTPSIAGIVRAA